jgi:hypothetical protein
VSGLVNHDEDTDEQEEIDDRHGCRGGEASDAIAELLS